MPISLTISYQQLYEEMSTKKYKKKQDEHIYIWLSVVFYNERNYPNGPLKAIMIPKSTSLKKYTNKICHNYKCQFA